MWSRRSRWWSWRSRWWSWRTRWWSWRTSVAARTWWPTTRRLQGTRRSRWSATGWARRLPRTRRPRRPGWAARRLPGTRRARRSGLPRTRWTRSQLSHPRQPRLASTVEPWRQRLAWPVPRRAVGRWTRAMGLGRTASAAVGWTAAGGVGSAATAHQLLGLQRATDMGSRLQPMGLLFLRDLDSAPDLTSHQDGRPQSARGGRPGRFT